MKLILELRDEDIGEEAMQVRMVPREAARAVAIKNGKIAFLNVSNIGYHKLPGGGVEHGEKIEDALVREMLEETGCSIKIIRDVGKVVEHRTHMGRLQTSYCFLVEVTDVGEPDFDEGEIRAGYQMGWATMEDALNMLQNEKPNTKNEQEYYESRFIIKRDLALLKAAKNYLVVSTKLLLTSSGITNKSLADALRNLAGRDLKIAFVPTAANVEEGPKYWLIEDLNNFQKLGTVDIVDISAVPKNVWLPRLKKANVIVIGGGRTSYLVKCIRDSGFDKELPELLKTRIYVGISAGSIVMSKSIQASLEFIYGDEVDNAPGGLGFIGFNIRPHFNSPEFPNVTEENLKKVSKKLEGDMYVIDDQTGIVVDGKITVVSEGNWLKLPGK